MNSEKPESMYDDVIPPSNKTISNSDIGENDFWTIKRNSDLFDGCCVHGYKLFNISACPWCTGYYKR